jgi:putative transposase
MIEQPNSLSLSRQCQLLGLSRAALYYRPVEVSSYELELMALIDRQYLRTPFYGSRRMTAWLQTQGHMVNRKRVQRLMGLMGLETIYQRPHTSRPAAGHRTYPYLLRGLVIERVNQVWAADITYIPMAHGFLYLVAVMDWVSRYVLAWRLSNLLDASFCIEALEEALSQGRPEIFNTDQGSQFTDEDFTSVLCAHGVAISMDGRGRFSDNIFVERLWRSLKYEEIYLRAYQNVAEARHGIASYFNFYNHERLHQALNYRAPRQVFEEAVRVAKLRRGRNAAGANRELAAQ